MTPIPDERPLIVTLRLDAASSDWFNALRRQYFPAERNFLSAHVTLFHALPGAQLLAVGEVLDAAEDRLPFKLEWTGWRSLGRGVAGYLHAPELDALHTRLSSDFTEWLTPQDRRRLSGHVTIQNKVAPETARETLTSVAETRPPSEVHAIGLDLHRYLGGPWEFVRTFMFGQRQ